MKFAAADVSQFQILPNLTADKNVDAWASMMDRQIEDIETELTRDDRRAIDESMFDYIGLTSKERKAVYDAALGLVGAREAKSRHVAS